MKKTILITGASSGIGKATAMLNTTKAVLSHFRKNICNDEGLREYQDLVQRVAMLHGKRKVEDDNTFLKGIENLYAGQPQ